MQKSFLHSFLFFLAFPLFGQVIQNASNIWYFGDRAGLDFNNSPPTALTDGQVNTQEGVATISDENGNLLFYTDGITVWDKNHQAMPNGNGTLNGHFSSTQSSVIVPNLSNPDLYYIFTTDELGNSNGLSYTSIDMSLVGNGTMASPLGNVANGQLNIQLATPVTEKITGILKPDCTGYWVVAHGWGNNRFFAFEVTSAGVNPNPVTSDVGNIHSGGTNNINAVGYMTATLDGQKLALVNRNNGTVDLYDFDKNAGIVSNEIEIIPNDQLMYGIAFSPSGNFLYIGGKDIISKYSLSTGTLSNIPIDDPSVLSGANSVRALQLGPDKNIYVSARGHNYISAIYDPDGSNPMLTTDAVFLDSDGAGRNCRFGLPNIFFFDIVPSVDSVFMSACPNSQVEYNGEFYPVNSVNELNFTTINGCDSVVVLTVDEFEVENEFLEFSACEGDFYNYNGNQILAGTQEFFTYTDINGCDSLVVVNVDISGILEDSISFEACAGTYYDYNGNQILAGAQEVFVYPNPNGCDTVLTVFISISEIEEDSLYVAVCEGEFFIFEGVAVAAGDSAQISTIDQNGCEILVNLFVEALMPTEHFINVTNCSDTIYSYLGTNIEIGEEAVFLLQNQYGCDSVVTVQVNGSNEQTVIDVSLCEGEYYNFNNEDYPIGTDTVFYFLDQYGCDSIVTLKIINFPEVDFDLNADPSCWNNENGIINVQNITEGTPPYEYSLDGQNYFQQSIFENLSPGTYEFFVKDYNSCIYQKAIEISEIPPIIIEYAPTILSCDEDSVSIEIDLVSGDPTSISWLWPDGSNNDYYFVSQPGGYDLEISNQCEIITENIMVNLEERGQENLIYIPNSFSPNDDGINDEFKIFAANEVEISNFEIKIFNRWGALVFESNDIEVSWNGVFRNRIFNPGVYAWWVRVSALSCRREINAFYEGDVTIIR